jgi:hydroxyacyl-ACP dehydratase HTD2-like protein with hotdog domain
MADRLPEFDVAVTPDSVARWMIARDGRLPEAQPAPGDAVSLSYLFFLRVQPAVCVSIHAELGRDPDRGLFGGVLYEADRGVRVGDCLSADAQVVERKTVDSPNGEMTLTTLRTVYTRADGETAVIETVRMVDLPPGPARDPADGPPADESYSLAADIGPCTPLQLAWMTVETGDLNRLHLDPAYARSRKFPDVVVPGTLLGPLIEQALEGVFEAPLATFDLRFRAASHPGEALRLHTAADGDGVRFELVGGGCVRAAGRAAPA